MTSPTRSYGDLQIYMYSYAAAESAAAAIKQHCSSGGAPLVSSSASLGSPSTGKCTHGANNVSNIVEQHENFAKP